MKLIFPNSQRINRGNYKKTSLAEACIDQKITDLILLKEHRGVPGWLTVTKFEWDYGIVCSCWVTEADIE
jgi:U3 small nucleolar ribonucleoprotein protein IMP4